MIVIGLTGSIGMGKTTTAAFFTQAGLPVLDSDQIVHELYRAEAVEAIEEAFPGTIDKDGVDRQKLADLLKHNPANFKKLEAIVHPLVQKRQRMIIGEAEAAGKPFWLLDIPLLFETGAEARVDITVLVSCAPDMQRRRVLSRPGMTGEKFDMILARQMPDVEKRRRADFIIDTGNGVTSTRDQVREILNKLTHAVNDGE